MVVVLLVRHAHAGRRKDWEADDRLRTLSARGVRQAASLVRRLEPWPPDRILSSPYVRCVQTVHPLADRWQRKIEEVPELAEGAHRLAVTLLRSLNDRVVALCTHGDVIDEVLEVLAKEDRLDLGSTRRAPKGSTWVLERRRSRFVKATYMAPGRG